MSPKQIRKLTGLTQAQFASKIGISRSTVIDAEAGNMSRVVAAIYLVLSIAANNCQSEMIEWFKDVEN